MADRVTIVKYEGSNEEMFFKTAVEERKKRVDVIVPETHFAVILRNGSYTETLTGGRHTLMQKGRKKEPVFLEVIFMSRTVKLKVLWGTKTQFVFLDGMTGETFRLGANGEIEVQILSPKQFYLEVVGTEREYDAAKLKARLQVRMMSLIESEIQKIAESGKWLHTELPAHKQQISDVLMRALDKMLELDYGLRLYSFFVSKLLINAPEAQTSLQEALRGEASGRLYCKNCGVALHIEDNFCFNCGCNVYHGKTGGTYHEPGSTYCSKCGQKLS